MQWQIVSTPDPMSGIPSGRKEGVRTASFFKSLRRRDRSMMGAPFLFNPQNLKFAQDLSIGSVLVINRGLFWGREQRVWQKRII
jgi:hypothetical protein